MESQAEKEEVLSPFISNRRAEPAEETSDLSGHSAVRKNEQQQS